MSRHIRKSDYTTANFRFWMMRGPKFWSMPDHVYIALHAHMLAMGKGDLRWLTR